MDKKFSVKKSEFLKDSITSNTTRPTFIIFNGQDGKEVGRLDLSGPGFKFIGDPDKVSKVFLKYLEQHFRIKNFAE